MTNEKKYINEDFFQIIGKISIVFATMDFFVTQLIFRLLSAEAYDNLRMNDNTTLGVKLEKIKKLKEKEVNYPLVLIELRKILPRAIKIAEERNRYIHDLWEFNENKISNGVIERVRIKRKNSLNINCTDITEEVTFKIEELNNFCNEIVHIQDVLGKIAKGVPLVKKEDIKNKGASIEASTENF